MAGMKLLSFGPIPLLNHSATLEGIRKNDITGKLYVFFEILMTAVRGLVNAMSHVNQTKPKRYLSFVALTTADCQMALLAWNLPCWLLRM